MAHDWLRGERYGKLPVEFLACDLTLTELRVVLALSVHAKPDGTCWPSKSKISTLIGVDGSHVRRALRSLESKGILRTQNRVGRSSYYTLQVPREVSNAPAVPTDPRLLRLTDQRYRILFLGQNVIEMFYRMPRAQVFKEDPQETVRLESLLMTMYHRLWQRLNDEARRYAVCSHGMYDHDLEGCDDEYGPFGPPVDPPEVGDLKAAQSDWREGKVTGLADWYEINGKINPWKEGFDIRAYIDELTPAEWLDPEWGQHSHRGVSRLRQGASIAPVPGQQSLSRTYQGTHQRTHH